MKRDGQICEVGGILCNGIGDFALTTLGLALAKEHVLDIAFYTDGHGDGRTEKGTGEWKEKRLFMVQAGDNVRVIGGCCKISCSGNWRSFVSHLTQTPTNNTRLRFRPFSSPFLNAPFSPSPGSHHRTSCSCPARDH
jgi:hypothetical protein